MAELRSPTVKRRRIARELKKLREQQGMKLTDAAKALGMSPGNLSKIENRETAARPMFVRAALALYGIIGDDAEVLVDISKGAQKRGWWQGQGFTEVLPSWFSFYVGLEEEAAVIATYESEIVPGLFQTERYARAMFRCTAGEEDIDHKVQARLRRQDILDRNEPVKISAILNEAVLTRSVGSSEITREQCDHLANLCALEHVSIQVLPFSANEHPAMTGPYVVLQFPDAVDEPVVYLDNFTSGRVLEEPEHFSWYNQTHEKLCAMALSPDDSLRFIQDRSRTIE